MRKIVLFFTRILVCAAMHAQESSYILMLSPGDTIPREVHGGLHVVFPVNKTYFDAQQESYQRLVRDLDRLLSDTTYFHIEAIHMYGAASPEGPYWNNVRLAKGRMARVLDSLEARFGKLNAEFYHVPEDYGRMLEITQGDSLLVGLGQYVADDDAVTKRNLMALNGGKTWKYLLSNYYPGLRAVNILIYVRKNDIMFIPLAMPIPVPKLEYPTELKFPIRVPQPPVTTEWKRQPMLRVKTNLIYDVGCVPNLHAEFLPRHGHITISGEILWNGLRNDSRYKTWIIHEYGFEGRFYFKGKAQYVGPYVSIGAAVGNYDIMFHQYKGYLSKNVWDSSRCNLNIGHAGRIKGRWTWETSMGFGMFRTVYDRYHGAEEWATAGQFYYDWHYQPQDYKTLNNRFTWFGPVDVSLKISYDLLHYRRERK